MNEHFFVFNGRFFRVGEPVISARNRALLYGDGLFETMRMQRGVILNKEFHFERLFHGMKLLQFDIPQGFTTDFFINAANELLLKNGHGENARIRLMVFRGEGGIFDNENNFPNYILETWPLSEKIELNKKGLIVDVFADLKKSTDPFSNIKSNSYLPSVMAGKFAQKNNLDDAVLLNVFGRICETSISNIFIIKDNAIFTPPLSEGCIAGIMRRFMLEKFSSEKYPVWEKELSMEDLLTADELFLTNSLFLLKWVKRFRNKDYTNEKVKEIFESIVQLI